MSTLEQKYNEAKSWIKLHPGCSALAGSYQVSYIELPNGSVEVTCIKCRSKTIIN